MAQVSVADREQIPQPVILVVGVLLGAALVGATVAPLRTGAVCGALALAVAVYGAFFRNRDGKL